MSVGLAGANASITDFKKLQDIGALTRKENLTELGKQLGSLPLHPSTSKMLLFAILLICLDTALTIACALGYREPFVLPMAPHEKEKDEPLQQRWSSRHAVVATVIIWQ